MWQTEKESVIESTQIAKEEALNFLALEREKFMKMSHQEAIKELIKMSNIDNKIRKIESINDNGLFSLR